MTGGKAPRAAGDRFERVCVAQLRECGYLVIRSAGSLGPADLVAMRGDGLPLLVSCKVTNATTKRERALFQTRAADAGCLALIATKPSPGRILWLRIGPEGVLSPYDIGEKTWPPTKPS